MAWKYIMVKNVMHGGTAVLFPLIFPDKLVHREVYDCTKIIMPAWRGGQGIKAVSAGMIDRIAVAGIGGESETLGVRYKEGDGEVIRMYQYQHGILP